MGKTIKQIAEEIGVSKQAVYKRLTGKLKDVSAPYLYREYNYICLTEEGEALVKNDFKTNPSTNNMERFNTRPPDIHISDMDRIDNTYKTSVPNTEQSVNAYVDNTPKSINTPPNSYTSYIAHTEQSETHTPNLYTNKTIQSEHEYSDNTYTSEQYTEQIHSRSETNTSAPDNAYAADTYKQQERIGNISEADTDQQSEIEALMLENLELKEKLHQKEIEIVKANAEIEKYNDKIAYMEQFLNDKNNQILYQKDTIAKIDAERKLLTASLFKNSEMIDNIIRISLIKRIFGWNNVQRLLIDGKTNTADNLNTDIISTEAKMNEE